MGDSVVNICNRALFLTGNRSSLISDINQTDSNDAANCRQVYRPLVEFLLRSAHWNFARRDTRLSLLRSSDSYDRSWDANLSPPIGFKYQYALPSDYIRARYIATYDGNGKFEIAGTNYNDKHVNTLITNYSEVILTYTANIEDSNSFDAGFTEALVYALASKLSSQTTGSISLSNQLLASTNEIIRMARREDDNEGVIDVNTVPDWISVRSRSMSHNIRNRFIYPHGSML